MAELRVNRGRRAEDFPDLCMSCGRPATVDRSKEFSWYPRWIAWTIFLGMLVFVILAVVLTRKRRLDLPLCDRHRNQWLWNTLLILGTFVGAVLVAGGSIAIAVAVIDDPEWVSLTIILVILPLLIGWIAFAVSFSGRPIHPKSIEENGTMVLGGVCQEFVDAYEDRQEEARRRWEEDDELRWADRRASRTREVRAEDDEGYGPREPDDRYRAGEVEERGPRRGRRGADEEY